MFYLARFGSSRYISGPAWLKLDILKMYFDSARVTFFAGPSGSARAGKIPVRPTPNICSIVGLEEQVSKFKSEVDKLKNENSEVSTSLAEEQRKSIHLTSELSNNSSSKQALLGKVSNNKISIVTIFGHKHF